MTAPHLPPIVRSVVVSWSPQAAFNRFTSQFGSWWPVKSHSIGGDCVEEVVFEPRVEGRIYERHRDGRRFQWGWIVAFEPPRRVCFMWHPSRDASTAQEVEVLFEAADGGTKVTLTASGWEHWGAGAARARKGYGLGWTYVLNVWAERRTAGMAVLDVMGVVISLVQWLRGGQSAAIARAGGEMARDRA